MTKPPSPQSVVKVGDGRGFVIERRLLVKRDNRKLPKGLTLRRYIQQRLVVTAAHCLPKLPPAHACSYEDERTYSKLLGRIDGKKTDVWAACLFVDPVADIAVLGCPDGQIPKFNSEGYDALVDEASPIRVGVARSGNGWLLALDSPRWIPTPLRVFSGLYTNVKSLAIGPTKPGMSGSPILNDRGQAIGVVAVGGATVRASGERREDEVSGPQPILNLNLPGWLLRG